MSPVSTLNGLSNELIICIFGYLKAEENFQSFFDYNDRFRKLVKCYVMHSRRTLDEDIERFSTLHSWYKHLHFVDGGVTFYMVPLKGEQERYNFSPCVSDRIGIHWHFWRQKQMPLVDKRIEQISQKYPIKLNPLFASHGSSNGIFMDDGRNFIRQYYPAQFEALSTTLFCRSYHRIFDLLPFYTDDAKATMQFIYENEPKRLRNMIQEAARCIWKEIQALEDVNLLDIKYTQQTAGFVMQVILHE
ncbi:unnamed protein product [Didymodactylos carnosus]|uniref:Uncharacterized protein n=1 Tax=Didymodactylos carnosus TaxID=1234261 RepID=A0A813XNQ4_9BILA|nr:unnamed protein product [Didymodactylos carnosus]CAF3659797.1 unnamed protein product [Didymodactylos carnosus]